MDCPFDILETASPIRPNDTDDLATIRRAIEARFNEDYEEEPIGDEVLAAILDFINTV